MNKKRDPKNQVYKKGGCQVSFASWHLFMKKFLLSNKLSYLYGFIIGRKNEGIVFMK
jgi:hypothetical protein